MNKYAVMFSDYIEHGIIANSEEEAVKIFIGNLINLIQNEDIGIIVWEES